MSDDLLDTHLSEIDGLSKEDRLLRLEVAMEAVLRQTTQVAELVNNAFDQLVETRQRLATTIEVSSDMMRRINELEERIDEEIL